MTTQLIVSPDTGGVIALYIWSETCPWQGEIYPGVERGTWLARIEHKDADDLDLPLNIVEADLGAFPTLHAAIEAYRKHDWAAADAFAGMVPNGDIVLG